MLVAIEHECGPQHIIEVAAEFAGYLDANVTLLRIVPPPPRPWVWMSGALLSDSAAYVDSFSDGHDLLEELALAVRQLERLAQAELRLLEGAFAGLEVSRSVAIDANAGRAIVAWLRRRPHDLVVIAARRRHPLLRLFAATTLDQVVRSRLATVMAAIDPQDYR
jgi:hypothetical protein